jgi:hypothetical protein
VCYPGTLLALLQPCSCLHLRRRRRCVQFRTHVFVLAGHLIDSLPISLCKPCLHMILALYSLCCMYSCVCICKGGGDMSVFVSFWMRFDHRLAVKVLDSSQPVTCRYNMLHSCSRCFPFVGNSIGKHAMHVCSTLSRVRMRFDCRVALVTTINRFKIKDTVGREKKRYTLGTF